MNGSSNNNSRPSDARRAALKEADNQSGGADGRPFVPTLSNLCPIERYYATADKVLDAFDRSFEASDLDNAYVLGRRFASFSIDALPTHDYYKSRKEVHTKLRRKNLTDQKRVVLLLEKVVTLMDEEEVVKRKKEEEDRKRVKIAEETHRRRMQSFSARKQKNNQDDGADLRSALQKLDSLNSLFPKVPSGVGESQEKAEVEKFDSQQFSNIYNGENSPVAGDLPMPVPVPSENGEDRNDNDQSNDENANGVLGLPPPPSYSQILRDSKKSNVPDAPPSYENLMSSKGKKESNQSLPSFQEIASEPKAQNIKKSKSFPIRTLQKMYISDYERMKKIQKIEVFAMSTHQGRVRSTSRDSTNGCAVISPLVVANHLKTSGAISDAAVDHVIDYEAGPILRVVRSKLGLGNHALIIPSDVHDYMVDEKILFQDKFVGVCGGNIMDEEHIGEFVNLLESGERNSHATKKTGAALFFHEHVISIVKIVLVTGVSWYDIVDSLPQAQSKNRASRTRCKDRQSLEVALRWYAITKFSGSNLDYIDRNQWDDVMCDFDPRVFQGFVWGE